MKKDLKNRHKMENSNNNQVDLSDLFPERIELLETLSDKIMNFNFVHNKYENLQNIFLIESGFGTGKTFFAKKLNEYLISKQINSVYFSAWENDYEKEPFNIISKYILKELININNKIIEQTKDFIKNKFLKIIKYFANKEYDISIGNSFVGEINTTFNPQEFIDNLKDTTDPIQDFKKELQNLINKLFNNKLILIIDELDRCRPDYAMKLLEIIKHFFDIEGLIIICLANKCVLNNSIKSLYNFDNNNSNSEDYILKFFFDKIILSPIDYEQYIITTLFDKLHLKTNISKNLLTEINYSNNNFYFLKESILELTKVNNNKISCRELYCIIEKIVDFYNKFKNDKKDIYWNYVVKQISKIYFERSNRRINSSSYDEFSINLMNEITIFEERNNYDIDKLKLLNQKNKFDNYYTFNDDKFYQHFLTIINENESKIIFGMTEYDAIKYKNYKNGETLAILDFNKYFEKAKIRMECLNNIIHNYQHDLYIINHLNELKKTVEELDKKVYIFQYKYGDIDKLTQVQLLAKQKYIDDVINDIFLIKKLILD